MGEKSRVEKSGVEKSGVEQSGVDMSTEDNSTLNFSTQSFNPRYLEDISTPDFSTPDFSTPLFPKPVIGHELFCRFIRQTGSRNVCPDTKLEFIKLSLKLVFRQKLEIPVIVICCLKGGVNMLTQAI